MEPIIICNSNNDYKMPHKYEEKVERFGKLPMSINILNKFKAQL